MKNKTSQKIDVKLKYGFVLQWNNKFFLQKILSLLHFRSCQNCMSCTNLVAKIHSKLCNERALSTGALEHSFISKFFTDFCDKIRRTHTVMARSKMSESQKNSIIKQFLEVAVESCGIWSHDHRIPFRRSGRLSYQTMSSTCTPSQLCTAALISSSVRCQISFRLLLSYCFRLLLAFVE